METELYRHFDASGRLLYVGITHSALLRLRGHKRNSGWFSEIATITVQRFPSKEEASRAETDAIKYERPAFNRKSTMMPAEPTMPCPVCAARRAARTEAQKRWRQNRKARA